MLASYVEVLKIPIGELVKTHTYSQLYLIGKGLEALVPKNEENNNEVEFTGEETAEEYLMKLQKQGYSGGL